MGKEFGNLHKIYGIVTFRISPHEQKPFAGLISHSIPNIIRRFKDSVLRVVPPFVITYLIIDVAEKEHHRLSRKNPKDFENDV
ncbi:cytochrome b-c1 complex subunit 8 [Orussus abietinus]|uniref:cytochrome b-c1 complex subunit 8 n=1 Tax=Orussus abietinus TaxID=222816 RepID=UPI0006263B95|nr:cytochrome b-c1 complex subunit 8 [Orussus abietinus]